MPPSPDTGVECFAHFFRLRVSWGIGWFTSLRGERAVVPRNGVAAVAGGSCRQGASHGATAPSVRLACEWRFRRFSCQGDLAAWPEGIGVAPGERWPSLSGQRRQEVGYRAHRIGCSVVGWGRKSYWGSVMLASMYACISNGLWPRGAALPMVYCLAAHDQHEAGRHVASYADAFSVTSSLHCWHWAFFSAVPSTRHK